MIKTNEIDYWPKHKIGRILTYDLQPVKNVEDVYRGEFILKYINTPSDFKERANDVDFRWNTRFGWGGFYPDPQTYSDDKKITPEETPYKMWLGGLYEYKGELYGYTYFT